ncbi:hypothetical protein L1887_33983 [Cichorium endivia]|nr:hypothetical protein L1887_33983 [Cichorium endivia]
MACLCILSVFTVCLLLGSWTSIVVASPSCPGVGISFTPCLDFFDHGREPSKACCNGIERVNKFAKTKDDRVAICKCLQAFLKGHKPRQFPHLIEKCHVDLKIPSVEEQFDCQ